MPMQKKIVFGGMNMNKKIVVVNAGPRKNRNTDTLLTEAAKGAALV